MPRQGKARQSAGPYACSMRRSWRGLFVLCCFAALCVWFENTFEFKKSSTDNTGQQLRTASQMLRSSPPNLSTGFSLGGKVEETSRQLRVAEAEGVYAEAIQKLIAADLALESATLQRTEAAKAVTEARLALSRFERSTVTKKNRSASLPSPSLEIQDASASSPQQDGQLPPNLKLLLLPAATKPPTAAPVQDILSIPSKNGSLSSASAVLPKTAAPSSSLATAKRSPPAPPPRPPPTPPPPSFFGNLVNYFIYPFLPSSPLSPSSPSPSSSFAPGLPGLHRIPPEFQSAIALRTPPPPASLNKSNTNYLALLASSPKSARCLVVTELANTGRHKHQYQAVFYPSWALLNEVPGFGSHVVDMMAFCEPGACEVVPKACQEIREGEKPKDHPDPRCFFQRLSEDYLGPMAASYRYGLSLYFMATPSFAKIASYYDYVMRSDVDAVLFPTLRYWVPEFGSAVGEGYMGTTFTHKRLEKVAKRLGLKHHGVHGMQSTFYVRAEKVVPFSKMLMNLSKYFFENEFKTSDCDEVRREGYSCGWPNWYQLVSTLYATDLAANHILGEPFFKRAQVTNKLDHCATGCYSDAYDAGHSDLAYSELLAKDVGQVHLLQTKLFMGEGFLVEESRPEFCRSAKKFWRGQSQGQEGTVWHFFKRVLDMSLPGICKVKIADLYTDVSGRVSRLSGWANDSSLYTSVVTPCVLGDFLEILPEGWGYSYDPGADGKGRCSSVDNQNFAAISCHERMNNWVACPSGRTCYTAIPTDVMQVNSMYYRRIPGWASDTSLYSTTTEPCDLKKFLADLPPGSGYYYDPQHHGQGFCKQVDVANIAPIVCKPQHQWTACPLWRDCFTAIPTDASLVQETKCSDGFAYQSGLKIESNVSDDMNATLCWSKCVANAECQYWDYGDGECTLRYGKGEGAEPALRYIGGPRQCKLEVVPGYLAMGHDCPGNDLHIGKGSTAECAEQCDSLDTCAGFSMLANTCKFKSQRCSKVSKNGWAFYGKQGIIAKVSIGPSETRQKCIETADMLDCDSSAADKGQRLNRDNKWADDQFEVSSSGHQVCVFRIDGDDWGMDLQISCAKVTTITVKIGPSEVNQMCVDTDEHLLCSRDSGDKNKRVIHPMFDDRFAIEVTGRKVCAQRLDETGGWGLDLQLACVKASSMARSAVLPEVIDGYTYLGGDCPGNDMSVDNGKGSRQHCAKHCRNLQNCYGFSFSWQENICKFKNWACEKTERSRWQFYRNEAPKKSKVKAGGCCQTSDTDDMCMSEEYLEANCIVLIGKTIGCGRGVWRGDKDYDPESGRCRRPDEAGGCCQNSEIDDTCADHEYWGDVCVKLTGRTIGCTRGVWRADKDYDSASGKCLTPKKDCMMPNHVWDNPQDMPGQSRTVERTDEACQQRCANVSGCAHFSRWEDGGCHLQPSNSIMFAEDGVTSGPPICPQEDVGSEAMMTSFHEWSV